MLLHRLAWLPAVAAAGCMLDQTGKMWPGVDTDQDPGEEQVDVWDAFEPDEDRDEDVSVDDATDPPPDIEPEDVESEPEMPECDGPMTVYYIDADSDGHGDIGGGVEWCAPPAGFVANHDDCYDLNSQAYPGQLDYFPDHRGDGSFDYDCDLVESPLHTAETSCDWSYCDGEGWVSGVPACGVIADWRRCEWWVVWCDIQNSSRQQLCR